ncbi:MAG: hypothetical protein D4S02_13950 [Rhodocyclaceae bacterium]|nr:MAG: hypothetical protein D4S02_13950 [Rhodocyclaceae bacterium]
MNGNCKAAVAAAMFVFCAGSANAASVALGQASATGISATITPDSTESGSLNVYMAVLFNGQAFLRKGASDDWRPLGSGALPVAGQFLAAGAQPVSISVTNLDVSAFVGLEVYVAYGLTEADLLRAGHLAKIHTVVASTSGGGTSTGSVSAPLAPLASGSYYTLVYAGNLGGIDQRRATATFAGNGGLSGYAAPLFDGSPGQEQPMAGTAVVSELAGDDKVSIGRWNGGTLAGSYYGTSMPTLTGNQGNHYAIGVKTATLPAAGTTKCYAPTAATRPTIYDGSAATGSLDTGSRIKVVFGNTGKFAVDLTATVGTNSVKWQTPGGIAGPVSFGTNGVYYDPSIFAPISFFASGRPTYGMNLFFAGTSAERVGVAYIRYTGSGTSSDAVYGAAYFSETACTQ